MGTENFQEYSTANGEYLGKKQDLNGAPSQCLGFRSHCKGVVAAHRMVKRLARFPRLQLVQSLGKQGAVRPSQDAGCDWAEGNTSAGI